MLHPVAFMKDLCFTVPSYTHRFFLSCLDSGSQGDSGDRVLCLGSRDLHVCGTADQVCGKIRLSSYDTSRILELDYSASSLEAE